VTYIFKQRSRKSCTREPTPATTTAVAAAETINMGQGELHNDRCHNRTVESMPLQSLHTHRYGTQPNRTDVHDRVDTVKEGDCGT